MPSMQQGVERRSDSVDGPREDWEARSLRLALKTLGLAAGCVVLVFLYRITAAPGRPAIETPNPWPDSSRPRKVAAAESRSVTT